MAKIELQFDKRFNEWEMAYPQEWHDTRDLFYDASELELSNEKESVKIYKKLLKKLPACDLDSYTHYGSLLKKKKRIFEGKALITRAFVLAKNCIPEQYYNTSGVIRWGNINNRSLLRTFHFAGLDFEEDGFFKEAEKAYNFLLNANPNDNQGARFLSVSLYIKQEDFDSFYKYCEGDEYLGIDGTFGMIIADFKTGKFNSAKEGLHNISKSHSILIKEILKKKHIEPDSLDYRLGYASGGSIEEAYYYYQRMSLIWKTNPDLIEFIKENSHPVL